MTAASRRFYRCIAACGSACQRLPGEVGEGPRDVPRRGRGVFLLPFVNCAVAPGGQPEPRF
jgi:hypothetical protein